MFDIKKIFGSKTLMYIMAVGSAVAAFMSSIDDQKKERLIEDLTERVSKLESK